MTHRYGRHGNKAWLRWRKKRFHNTSPMHPPHVAVLQIPLEFLSRIRKVTILMTDGTEQRVELQTNNALSSPIVDATVQKGISVLPELIQNPQDKFFIAAREIAQMQAKRIFYGTVDPYHEKPGSAEAQSAVSSIY